MYKICIWTPTITHHQSSFHDAIINDGRIDLKVRYFNKISKERLELGWEDKQCNKPFEEKVETLNEALTSLNDFNKRIHIISGNGYLFTKELINYCIENNFKWVNWTERSGIRLFYLLGKNSFLFNIFFPIYQRVYNRKFAQQIEKYALGTFVSGIKAEEDYLKKGVSAKKISHLYYALEPLNQTTTIPTELKLSTFKYHFIYAGTLSQGKGIDLLLKAYANLKSKEWGLVLVGKDISNGEYKSLIKKLNIEEKVVLVGAINFNRMNEYLSFADVFILPTRFDGWGAVLNEAASLGLPIISTDECGAAYHLIENKRNGYRIKTNSINELTFVMNQYINNPNNIINHGRESKKIFEYFLPKENVHRLRNALSKWEKNR